LLEMCFDGQVPAHCLKCGGEFEELLEPDFNGKRHGKLPCPTCDRKTVFQSALVYNGMI